MRSLQTRIDMAVGKASGEFQHLVLLARAGDSVDTHLLACILESVTVLTAERQRRARRKAGAE